MRTFVNLTYQGHNGMFKYPTDPEPVIDQKTAELVYPPESLINDESGFPTGSTSQGRYKSGFGTLNLRNHHGTHVDAPAHKFPSGKTIDQYDDTKFVNTSRLIDLTQTNLLKRNQRKIELRDLIECCPQIDSTVSSVILYTGFCDEMTTLEGKLTPQEKLAFEKTFPYLSSDAAGYLSGFGFNLIGLDSFSIDPSGSNSESHRQLLAKDVLILETLVNLGELKRLVNGNQFCLVSIPDKIIGSDAGRTVAWGSRSLNE